MAMHQLYEPRKFLVFLARLLLVEILTFA